DGDLAAGLRYHHTERGGADVHGRVGELHVGEVEREFARPSVHLQRGRDVVRDGVVDVRRARLPEAEAVEALVDPHVGPIAGTRVAAQAKVAAVAGRVDRRVGEAAAVDIEDPR